LIKRACRLFDEVIVAVAGWLLTWLSLYDK
jgi:hypothetical protein